MDKYIVFGDLNCPYSYALHVKLKSLSLLEQVEFKLVEHAPDLGLYGNRLEILTELASDVFSVRSLAEDLPLALPPERPDSRFAILCIIAAAAVNLQKANALRDSFYTALWVEGKDISCPSVIFNCIEKVGLPAELEVDDNSEKQLEQWQMQLDKSKVGSRIPAVIATDGRKLLGLPSAEEIQAFFNGEKQTLLNESTKLQRSASLHSIAILCSADIRSMWTPIEAIRGQYNLLLPASIEELKLLFNSEDHAPDLVLLHADEHWSELLSSYQNFIERMKISYTPIAIIGAQDNDELELSAYASGAADYISRGRSAGILKARIAMMLDLKKSRDFLERSARIDGLTGINNRREFERLLEQEWRRSSRACLSLSLIMLDVDFFKKYNDEYGHLAGDSALRKISKVLQITLCRPYDAVCRYGGEEFAILMPETNIEGAKQIAEQIRKAIIAEAIIHQTSSVADVITVSQGVASFIPSDNLSPMQLIQAADKALYEGKHKARNIVCAADALY